VSRRESGKQFPGAVTFLNTEMTEVIRPEGWHNWDRPDRESSARFAESGSRGAGAASSRRVAWARMADESAAAACTAAAVLGGRDHWVPGRR
jgi:pectinesterase